MTTTRKLTIDPRNAYMAASATIKNDPKLALVELLTNSDDSYRRMKGQVDGRIQVELYRRWKGSFMVITDFAQGLTDKQMDEKVGNFGGEQNEFTPEDAGRGYWGRGLKEAILAMGHGIVESIVDDTYYRCELDDKQTFTLDDPKPATKRMRNSFQGAEGNCTRITITITNPKAIVPQFDQLRRYLRLNYNLRLIVTSDKRELVLRSIDASGAAKAEDTIHYNYPVGREVVKETLTLPSYPDAKAHFQVSLATDDLTGEEEGVQRTNGVLVATKGAVLDCTLGTYEHDASAVRIFGTVTCDYIDVLLRGKEKEPIINDRRTGLDWTHPFCRELKAAVSQALKPVVEEERKRQASERKNVENERTKKRFEKAFSALNSIAKEALADLEDLGDEKDAKGKSPKIPEGGFGFMPDYMQVLVNYETNAALIGTVPKTMTAGKHVSLRSEDEFIRVGTDRITITPDMVEAGIAKIPVPIEGTKVGAEGFVVAEVDGREAMLLVRVVSERKESKPRKKRQRAGLFRDYQFDTRANPGQRVRFERDTGIIIIASSAPSVEAYFGPGGERQDEGPCQVLLAELLTEAVCRELAIRRVDSGQEVLPEGDRGEGLTVVYNKLVAQYAHRIHAGFVDERYRR